MAQAQGMSGSRGYSSRSKIKIQEWVDFNVQQLQGELAAVKSSGLTPLCRDDLLSAAEALQFFRNQHSIFWDDIQILADDNYWTAQNGYREIPFQSLIDSVRDRAKNAADAAELGIADGFLHATGYPRSELDSFMETSRFHLRDQWELFYDSLPTQSSEPNPPLATDIDTRSWPANWRDKGLYTGPNQAFKNAPIFVIVALKTNDYHVRWLYPDRKNARTDNTRYVDFQYNPDQKNGWIAHPYTESGTNIILWWNVRTSEVVITPPQGGKELTGWDIPRAKQSAERFKTTIFPGINLQDISVRASFSPAEPVTPR